MCTSIRQNSMKSEQTRSCALETNQQALNLSHAVSECELFMNSNCRSNISMSL